MTERLAKYGYENVIQFKKVKSFLLITPHSEYAVKKPEAEVLNVIKLDQVYRNEISKKE